MTIEPHIFLPLSALLGRSVDLVPRNSLKPIIRDAVLASEQVVYAA